MDFNELVKKTEELLDRVMPYFTMQTKYGTLFRLNPNESVVVYGEGGAGKSAFLFSICGMILLNDDSISITYVDVDGKDIHRAKLFKELFNDNFIYIASKHLKKEDIFDILSQTDSQIVVVDMYHLLFDDIKYDSFFRKLNKILSEGDKSLIFSAGVYRSSSEIIPRGGNSVKHTTSYSLFIKKVTRSKLKRVIEETRYSNSIVAELKDYKGHRFFDFFINALGDENGRE